MAAGRTGKPAGSTDGFYLKPHVIGGRLLKHECRGIYVYRCSRREGIFSNIDGRCRRTGVRRCEVAPYMRRAAVWTSSKLDFFYRFVRRRIIQGQYKMENRKLGLQYGSGRTICNFGCQVLGKTGERTGLTVKVEYQIVTRDRSILRRCIDDGIRGSFRQLTVRIAEGRRFTVGRDGDGTEFFQMIGPS